MLISYKDILTKYQLRVKNILHVGAHVGEEAVAYFMLGAERVIWVEANPTLIPTLKSSVVEGPSNMILEACVSDRDGDEVVFNVTNNQQSSSILELGEHSKLYPGIVVVDKKKMKTVTLKTLFTNHNLRFADIQFLNLDIQGAELKALIGIGGEVQHISAVYTEVNTSYVYKNCCLVGEIDDYLRRYGFKRVETAMWGGDPWGDALYINEKRPDLLS